VEFELVLNSRFEFALAARAVTGEKRIVEWDEDG
jgi:hypothetical protein